MTITYPNTSGGTSKKGYYLTQANNWSSGSKLVSLRAGSSSGAVVAQAIVEMPETGTWLVEAANGNHYGLQVKATFKAGNKTYTYNGEI